MDPPMQGNNSAEPFSIIRRVISASSRGLQETQINAAGMSGVIRRPVVVEEPSVEELIEGLQDDNCRGIALQLLIKIQNKPQNFASLLWFSYDTVWIILKEILEIYRPMAAEILTIEQANCASNAITLLQFIAASSETRPSFLRAKIVYYLFPFLKLTNISKPYEHLRVSSLIVIGALVKSGDPEVMPYLLDMESFPLVLHCLQIGGFLSKVIASFIIRKIASDKLGLHYCCHPAERFYFISKTFRRIFDNILDDLENILERLAHDTLLKLFRNIILCYLKWSECPRARDALSLCLPTRFTAPVVAHMFQEDPVTYSWVQQTMFNVTMAQKLRSQQAAEFARSSFRA